jgi:aminocarboxymuconate-semialdehyde decarboxylase
MNGRRIKTIDIHAHCAVPEALALMGHKLEGPQNRPDLDMATTVSLCMKLMDTPRAILTGRLRDSGAAVSCSRCRSVRACGRKLGLRGIGFGGNVAGMEISDPALNPFWAKAESLGILVFIHPQGDGAPSQLGHRFRGTATSRT